MTVAPEKEKRTRLTFDEAMDLISEIARDGEGADKLRALKLAMSMEQGGSSLPEPLSDHEIEERLARLIRAVGPTGAQLAYRKAFPAAKRAIHHSAPKVTERDIAPIDKSELPGTLRSLYKMFPEVKRPGIPKGYPVNSGLAVKKAWCQKEAYKMILDREQRKLDIIASQEPADGPAPVEA